MAGRSREETLRIAHADIEGLCRAARRVREMWPDVPVRSERLQGACLLLMGPGHVVNRVAGLGLDAPVEPATLEFIERASAEAGVPAQVEVWPGCDPGLQVMLEARGYVIVQRFRVLVAEPAALVPVAPAAPDVSAAVVTGAEAELYEVTVARGFMNSDDADPGKADRVFARVAARHPGTTALLARVDGEPAGGGAMSVHDGVAGFFGASTLPRFRGRGVQRELLRRRLEIARDAGCELASVKTVPDSASERNVRRAGFQALLETVCWSRPGP